MGSSSSSETAGKIEDDKTENFGLLNISNASHGFNALEVVTFVLVATAAVVFLKMCCARRRKKRMAELQRQLEGINLPAYSPQAPAPAVPAVHVHASRVPIMAPGNPPLYPGPANVEKYNI